LFKLTLTYNKKPNQVSKKNMKKLFLLIITIVSLNALAIAKDGYNIKVKIQNNTDTLVYLCHYYGKGVTVYKDDSSKVGKDGTIQFESKAPIIGGIYILLGSDKINLLEFLIQNGDNFEFSFDKSAPVKTAEFKNNEENTNFYKYQKYLTGISERYQVITADLVAAKTRADTAAIDERSKLLTKEMVAFRRNFVKEHPKSISATIFNALDEPEIPTKIPNLTNGRPDSNFAYKYYKTHYWDLFNFQDDKIIYSPLYEKKLEEYFKLVVSVPDSFNKEADLILKKTKGTKELGKYSLWWLTRYAETSKVMGMDQSFVHMVENYYMKGDANWLDSASLAKYIKRAMDIAPNMIGQTAADIRIPDINENMSSLTAFAKGNDYTLLIFYDPTCGHCKKEIPSCDSVVNALRNKKIDIKIFGIENAQEDVKWKEFIKEHNLAKDYWLHLHDPNGIGNYRSKFDVYSNPILYLLDKNGKIVGKRIDHNNLGGLVEHLEEVKNKKS
jgi:peroxiredoxin